MIKIIVVLSTQETSKNNLGKWEKKFLVYQNFEFACETNLFFFSFQS